jgi:hypothetical protein
VQAAALHSYAAYHAYLDRQQSGALDMGEAERRGDVHEVTAVTRVHACTSTCARQR